MNAEGMTCNSHGRKSMVKEQQTPESPEGTTEILSGSACRPFRTIRCVPGLTFGARTCHRFAIHKTAQLQNALARAASSPTTSDKHSCSLTQAHLPPFTPCRCFSKPQLERQLPIR